MVAKCSVISYTRYHQGESAMASISILHRKAQSLHGTVFGWTASLSLRPVKILGLNSRDGMFNARKGGR